MDDTAPGSVSVWPSYRSALVKSIEEDTMVITRKLLVSIAAAFTMTFSVQLAFFRFEYSSACRAGA